MTPQEQQMLDDLARKVDQTALQEKDPEAEQYLQQTLGRNPDALYILAQTVLVQQYALDQAQKQMESLRQQGQAAVQNPPPQKHTSFLGNLLGMNDDKPQQPQYSQVQSAPPPPPQQQYGSPYASQPQYSQPVYQQAPAQGGGFLRNAMQTAAGVAAGAIAFQGIENLMGGFEHHAGYGGGSGFEGGPREEVVNNYYGDSGDRQGYESRDIEDRRDDSFGNRLADADSGDRDRDNDQNQDDNNDDGSNDSGNDDSGDNYDPGGTDDSF